MLEDSKLTFQHEIDEELERLGIPAAEKKKYLLENLLAVPTYSPSDPRALILRLFGLSRFSVVFVSVFFLLPSFSNLLITYSLTHLLTYCLTHSLTPNHSLALTPLFSSYLRCLSPQLAASAAVGADREG